MSFNIFLKNLGQDEVNFKFKLKVNKSKIGN